MKPFEERRKEFLEKYEALTKELMCDVASGPQWVPIGGGAFTTIMTKDIVDLESVPKKSPFSDV